MRRAGRGRRCAERLNAFHVRRLARGAGARTSQFIGPIPVRSVDSAVIEDLAWRDGPGRPLRRRRTRQREFRGSSCRSSFSDGGHCAGRVLHYDERHVPIRKTPRLLAHATLTERGRAPTNYRQRRFGTTMNPERKQVVIVGGGFGGLEAAKALDGRDVDVTLIDRANYHLFQPLLYQVAMAGLSPADIASPIRGILAEQPNVRVVLGDVSARRSRRPARLRRRDEPSPTTGSSSPWARRPRTSATTRGRRTRPASSTSRTPSRSAAACCSPSSAPSASRTRARDASCSRSSSSAAAPPGVELAGAIAELSHFVLGRDFRAIDPREAKVVLIEAGPRILPSFSTVARAERGRAAPGARRRGPHRATRRRHRRRRRRARERATTAGRARTRAHRLGHRRVGRGREGQRPRAEARRADGQARPRHRRERLLAPRPPRGLRDRRHGALRGERQGAPRRQPGRDAAGALRRQDHPLGARERGPATARAVLVFRQGLDGDHRALARDRARRAA